MYFSYIEAFKDHIQWAFKKVAKNTLQDIINKNNSLQNVEPINGFYFNGDIYNTEPVKAYLCPQLNNKLESELNSYLGMLKEHEERMNKLTNYLFTLDSEFKEWSGNAPITFENRLRNFFPEIFFEFKNINDQTFYFISYESRRKLRVLPKNRTKESPINLPQEILDILDTYLGYRLLV